MAWGMHGGTGTAAGTVGGHYAGPEYEGNQSPAQTSPYIKSEEEIKQDILRDRYKQLYGTGSSGFQQGTTGAPVVNPSINPTLNAIINFMQGRIGNARINANIPGRRINLNVPLLNAGGGLISGQGSYSPYGGNFLGFQYKKSW